MATSEGIPSSIDIEFLELNDNPYLVLLLLWHFQRDSDEVLRFTGVRHFIGYEKLLFSFFLMTILEI